MIDFENATFIKLRSVPTSHYEDLVAPMLVDGEKAVLAFQTIRDGIVFTTKRMIAINVQGLTGKKKDMTSLPYARIQAFSVETAGVLDMDSELELWFSGLGKVRFEFSGKVDIVGLCRVIGAASL